MAHPARWSLGDIVAQEWKRLCIMLEHVLGKPQETGGKRGVERVKSHVGLKGVDRSPGISRKHQSHGEGPVHVVWIQRNGSFKRGDRGVVLVPKREDNSEAGMSQGQIRIELYSLASQFVGLVEGTRIEMVAVKGVNPGGVISTGQDGVGSSIVWIDRK